MKSPNDLLFLLFILSHFALNAIFVRPFKIRPMFEQSFKNIDDILRKEAGCQSELDYIEQTPGFCFLNISLT